ncbi:hypothetical protein GCM10025862_39180 [Arsenicicoccus piscis]|uniref:Uncharacterized protein n=1 Tax=Arsenicicoccus piscis TaxID=673954 RepID=A0ABQ6HU30_9MICO|nr:hypothetical protein GCM10025862_39180 [Arsenicicoccus piscis]
MRAARRAEVAAALPAAGVLVDPDAVELGVALAEALADRRVEATRCRSAAKARLKASIAGTCAWAVFWPPSPQ